MQSSCWQWNTRNCFIVKKLISDLNFQVVLQGCGVSRGWSVQGAAAQAGQFLQRWWCVQLAEQACSTGWAHCSQHRAWAFLHGCTEREEMGFFVAVVKVIKSLSRRQGRREKEIKGRDGRETKGWRGQRLLQHLAIAQERALSRGSGWEGQEQEQGTRQGDEEIQKRQSAGRLQDSLTKRVCSRVLPAFCT